MAAAEPDQTTAGNPARAKPFSVFERMVAWRYLRSRRKEAFISVIAGFSFLGIMLGVATLIIVMAVMNGFRSELVSRILGINGHIVVLPAGQPFPDYAALTQRIEGVEGFVLPFRWSRARRWSPARKERAAVRWCAAFAQTTC
nr:ABC transporter permease [Marinicella sp. W31]MDC2877551.1 ABC transporter permease [Marinicella sp. W31]